jgi:hypothetical protein
MFCLKYLWIFICHGVSRVHFKLINLSHVWLKRIVISCFWLLKVRIFIWWNSLIRWRKENWLLCLSFRITFVTWEKVFEVTHEVWENEVFDTCADFTVCTTEAFGNKFGEWRECLGNICCESIVRVWLIWPISSLQYYRACFHSIKKLLKRYDSFRKVNDNFKLPE